ncbi:hypothetical protein [Streptomyces bungoensis]|uniref:hypothetical protein n=1 Tax=Streptomyces bungoensis TaxID=285568 RepID=UPI003133A1C5
MPSKSARAIRVCRRRFDLFRLDAVHQAGQGRENVFGDVVCRHAGYVGLFPDLGDSTLQAPLDVMDQLVRPQADLARGTGHETVRREVHKTTLRCTGVDSPSGFGERGPACARSALKPLTQARGGRGVAANILTEAGIDPAALDATTADIHSPWR